MSENNQFLVYSDAGGQIRVQVRMEKGELWLSQAQIGALYGTTPQNITQHIRKIYESRELEIRATCKDFLQVQSEGSRNITRSIEHYNLPMILAIGFRVQSPVGTRFRQWAIQALEQYAVKGFVVDAQRLKAREDDSYFEDLLATIRDIRSSERVFYRKVLDIYATSIDYDKNAEGSKRFFQTVQNKMHWAAHGQTAAEVIYSRANAEAPNMGLTGWAGSRIRKADSEVAKNYLSVEELEALNRIVSAYLEFAELQATGRRPMTMVAWATKLDDFLKLSDRDVLSHAGKISAEVAQEKATLEYRRWQETQKDLPRPVDADFEAALQETKQLEKQRPARRKSEGSSGGRP